ncbi:MAG: ATP-dependent DNA helicase, partial [Rhodospirillales bacterium]|nr:ATP-dependent DNA helicase [Rhodospirillales bacterium]
SGGVSSYDPDEDNVQQQDYRHRGAYREKLQSADVWQSDYRDDSGRSFDVGGRVFHQKFGYGSILHVDGNKLEVAFEKAGTKKVMDSFVEQVDQ